jgi:hypothetical protein
MRIFSLRTGEIAVSYTAYSIEMVTYWLFVLLQTSKFIRLVYIA